MVLKSPAKMTKTNDNKNHPVDISTTFHHVTRNEVLFKRAMYNVILFSALQYSNIRIGNTTSHVIDINFFKRIFYSKLNYYQSNGIKD